MDTKKIRTSELSLAADAIGRRIGMQIDISGPYHEKFTKAFGERSLALGGRLSDLVSVILGGNVAGIVALFPSNMDDSSVIMAEKDRITGKRYIHKVIADSGKILFVDLLEAAEKRD